MADRSLVSLLRLAATVGAVGWVLAVALVQLAPPESAAACGAAPPPLPTLGAFADEAAENALGDAVKARLPASAPAEEAAAAAAAEAERLGAAYFDAFVSKSKGTSSLVFLIPYAEKPGWSALAIASLSRTWLRLEFEFDRSGADWRIKEVWTTHPIFRVPLPGRHLGGCPSVPWASPEGMGAAAGRSGGI